MLSIGEFSKITGLSVKTLRFYHEAGVLVPSHVDRDTGYRYYALSKIDEARIIKQLSLLEFPLEEIADILKSHDDDADLLEFLERRKQAIEDKVRAYREIG